MEPGFSVYDLLGKEQVEVVKISQYLFGRLSTYITRRNSMLITVETYQGLKGIEDMYLF